MSRVSVLVVTLVALNLTGSAPAQDKEKVLQTVRKLESRLAQIDRYFSGLQSSEAGAMHAEIVSMQKALSATRDQFAEQATELTARAEGAEQALSAMTAERDTAQKSLATLAEQLDESRSRTQGVEHDLQALRAQAATAADRVAAAEVSARTAEEETARVTAELANAILEGQASQREREALVQRAEDAGASLAAEQDRVAELEYQLDDLRAQLARAPEASTTPTVLQIPTLDGIQIHVHGGEANFYINGNGLPLIGPPPPRSDLPGDPNLRLRLRQDGVSDRIPPVTPRTLPPRIHFP